MSEKNKKNPAVKNDKKVKDNTNAASLLDFDDDDPLGATSVSKKSLVIFFLIDTSGSMNGKKMGELNTIMEELIPEIRRVGEAGACRNYDAGGDSPRGQRRRISRCGRARRKKT